MNDELRILLPLDGTAEAESALPLAAPLFRARPVRLTLFRVVRPDQAPQMARAYLERVRDALLAHQAAAEIKTGWGAPAEEILWLAKSGRFDLIAMTTHGRGGIRRLFGGSVAEEVVGQAPIPVLLNRPGQPFTPWTRIVVPLDGSVLAERVLPDVLRLAGLFGAEVHFVQAVLPTAGLGGEDGAVPLVPLPDPTPYLQTLCGRAAVEGVSALPVPLEGAPTAAILSYVEKVKAGLVCMTTHGRSGLARLAFGSTAVSVIREASCPVLVRRAVDVEAPAEVARR